MTTTVMPYGAVELKQVAQRYWMFGFLISVLLHASLVAAFQFHLFGIDHVGLPIDVKHHRIDLTPPNYPIITGVYEVPRAPAQPQGVRPKDGAPIPVPESSVPANQTILTQIERMQQVSPGVEGVGEGTGGVIVDVPDPPGDVAPKEFVPVSKEPAVAKSVPPVYPEAARRAGLEGRVLVKLWVTKEGTVHQAVVVQSTAEILNDAALEAARQFVFTPAYTNAGPVAVWVHIPFVFRLH